MTEREREATKVELPVILLFAGLVFAMCEAAFGLALRWYHAPLYYALVIGLTVGLSAGIGAVFALTGASLGWALVGWSAVCAGLSEGWAHALLIGASCAAALRIAAVRSAPGPLLGACAATGLVLALLRGEGLAKLVALDALPWSLGEGFAAATLHGLVFAGVPWAWSHVAERVKGTWACVLVVTGGLSFSMSPMLDAPDGTKRLPSRDMPRRGSEPLEKPHVFLLVLDTVRADHLSVYGYERDTTPELARMVRERPNARVYEHAYANGTWTVPSHATLFTGMLPNEHGVHFALDGSLRYRFGLREEDPTLAEGLHEAGYATLGSFSNNWLRVMVGMKRGFDRYFLAPNYEPLPFAGEALRSALVPGLAPEAAKGGARASDVNGTLLSMIEPWSQGAKPLFVFGNYGDAHGPYAPPPGFRGLFGETRVRERPEHLSLAMDAERIEEMKTRYDEELRYLDHELGRFFARLDELGILDEAWIFLTSDHGEAFGEHGVLEHGTTVHNEVSRIPLVVFPPAGVTLPADDLPVSLVDVARTIAEIGGVELKGPGRDLRQARAEDHLVAIEFYGDAAKAQRHGASAKDPARAVLVGRYKLILRGTTEMLYDVLADPRETRDLAGELPEVVERLRALLPPLSEPHRLGTGDFGGSDSVDDLKAMGYVGP